MRASNSSRRGIDGGVQLPGALMRDAILPRNSNSDAVTSSRRLNSRVQQRELSIDLREFATGLFLGGFVALAAVLFGVGFFGYRALVL